MPPSDIHEARHRLQRANLSGAEDMHGASCKAPVGAAASSHAVPLNRASA